MKLRPLVYNKFSLLAINPENFIKFEQLEQELFRKQNHISQATSMAGIQRSLQTV